MSQNKLDNEITQLLKEETNEITKFEHETWNKIEAELFQQDLPIPQKGKQRFFIATAIVIMLGIALLGFTSTTGQALFQSLKEKFVEEKNVELNIEGQKENTHTELATNEELRYVIYVDTSRYKLVHGELTDEVVLIEELPDKYPEVSMEIIHKTETTMEAEAEVIKQQLTDLNMDITIDEQVNEPITALKLSAIGQGITNKQGYNVTDWDTPIYEYYITEDEGGQLFVIKQIYFLEAAEGHGVRFDSMLESFEIVN